MKQKPIKTIATKADVAWNLPCEDVPQCPDFFLQAVAPSQALRKLSARGMELAWQMLGKRSPGLCVFQSKTKGSDTNLKCSWWMVLMLWCKLMCHL